MRSFHRDGSLAPFVRLLYIFELSSPKANLLYNDTCITWCDCDKTVRVVKIGWFCVVGGRGGEERKG